MEKEEYIGRKPRTFEKNEEVCIVDALDGYVKAVVEIETVVEYDDDLVGVYPIVNRECDSERRIAVPASEIYQIAEGKVCPRCGGQLCYEHQDEIDYPYYCPECQENFYGIEVG